MRLPVGAPRARVRGDGPPPRPARAGRLHPGPQGLPADRADRGPAGADPAARDRAARRDRAGARAASGPRRRHRQRRDRPRGRRRASRSHAWSRPTPPSTRVRVAQTNTDRLGLADRVDVVLRGVDSLGIRARRASLRPAPREPSRMSPRANGRGWRPRSASTSPRDALVAGADRPGGDRGAARGADGLAKRPTAVAPRGRRRAGRRGLGAGRARRLRRRSRSGRDLAGIDRVVVGR